MSRRARSRAAAVAAKHVALVPLAGHDEDHADEDETICADCGAPHDACDCSARWEHDNTGPGHPGDPGRF